MCVHVCHSLPCCCACVGEWQVTGSCVACGEGKTTLVEGASNETECVCNVGYYTDVAASAVASLVCLRCPAGTAGPPLMVDRLLECCVPQHKALCEAYAHSDAV